MRSGVAFMPCYHPAAALHNGSMLGDLQKDFDRVGEYLKQVFRGEPEDGAPSPTEAEAPGPLTPEATPPAPPLGEQLELI
jgi:hypothetical protein